MALSTNTTRNLTDGVLVLKDGGASAGQKTLTVPIDAGDLSWTENEEMHTVHKRKSIAGRASGREQPCELKFTVLFEAYTGDSSEDVTTPVDVFNRQGGAAAWVSTEPSGPFSFDVHFQVTSPDANLKHELMVFPSCAKSSIEISEDEDFTKVTVTLQSLAAKPTVTRVASF